MIYFPEGPATIISPDRCKRRLCAVFAQVGMSDVLCVRRKCTKDKEDLGLKVQDLGLGV